MKDAWFAIFFAIFIIAFACFIGWAIHLERKPYQDIASSTNSASNSEFETKTMMIDGCEYFAFEGSHGRVVITHKGNCKNPVHMYRTEKQ